MSLGIGLLMPPAADGRPTAVYLADIDVVCGGCGKQTMRRYFLSTMFHALTTRRLVQLFESIPDAVEGHCEQCGAPFHQGGVSRWSMQFSPGDGDGLLMGIEHAEDEGPAWRVAPQEYLDVQAQPQMAWEEHDISSVPLPVLDEAHFYAALGRYLNPKSAVRQAILSRMDAAHPAPPCAQERKEGAVIVEPAPGLRCAIGDAEAVERALSTFAGGVVRTALVDMGVVATGYPDAPSAWLGDLGPYLEGLSVVVTASTEPIEASLRRHFLRFPIDLHFESPGGALRVVAGDGIEDESVLDFDLERIAKEASRTASAPGDIARAEIDRALTLLNFTSL